MLVEFKTVERNKTDINSVVRSFVAINPDNVSSVKSSGSEYCDVKMIDDDDVKFIIGSFEEVVDKLNCQEDLMTAEKAMADLRKVLAADKSYAHDWHCSIVCSVIDSFHNGDILNRDTIDKYSNEAATHFMKNCFDVETKG